MVLTDKERVEFEMYLTQLEWRGWYFYIEEDQQIFGKTKVVAEKDEYEEVFYTGADYLSEELCEEWYHTYLYMYE